MKGWLNNLTKSLFAKGLTVTSLLLVVMPNPLLAQSVPDRTEVRRIDRRVTTNVQRYVGRWEIARQDQVLGRGNWLATGRNSMAWMWYNSIGVIYRQTQNTFSQFIAGSACGFQVSAGGTLFLESGRRARCRQIAGNVRITPPSAPRLGLVSGDLMSLNLAKTNDIAQDVIESEAESTAVAFFLFRNQDTAETVVGVLASPLGAVAIEPAPARSTEEAIEFDNIDTNETSNRIALNAGEFAFIRDNGEFVRGEFSLERFYENNPLALGLGPSQEDQAYVDQIATTEEKALFTEIRTATLQALSEQPEANSFAIRTLDDLSITGLINQVALPPTPQCGLAEGQSKIPFSCPF